jgi:hypothetical protein
MMVAALPCRSTLAPGSELATVEEAAIEVPRVNGDGVRRGRNWWRRRSAIDACVSVYA